MKIKYNEAEKIIEIQDKLNGHYFILKFLMILNLTTALYILHDIHKTGLGVIKMIWVFVGTVSLIVLYFLIFKKSTPNKIPIEKIDHLKQRTIFVRKIISLELNNGKSRDLNEIKTKTQIKELKEMFSEIGIAN
ncbi:hypothetical protein [Christiangramia aquimixticola]|uniref:hypothetical protein n=1 Tax=Christiangramia aquimixticola TaxID=1697558 RepID=UPI003AA97B9C